MNSTTTSNTCPRKQQKQPGYFIVLSMLLTFLAITSCFAIYYSYHNTRMYTKPLLQEPQKIPDRMASAPTVSDHTVPEYADHAVPDREIPDTAFADSTSPDWRLTLVNPWQPLPDSHSVTLVQLKNGQAIDTRAYPDLQAMMDDCRAAGLSPLICSSYRTRQTQEKLFYDNMSKFIAQGYSLEEAQEKTKKSVAFPGTSEHELGLALDIVDVKNQKLDASQEYTAVQQWLMEHSWEYGFILRYPRDKSDLTGIMYEPWHYRYVGREAAQEIHEQNLCLEEYVAQASSSAIF